MVLKALSDCLRIGFRKTSFYFFVCFRICFISDVVGLSVFINSSSSNSNFVKYSL